MNRHRVQARTAAVVLFVLVFIGGSVLTARQEPAKEKEPTPSAPAPAADKEPPPGPRSDAEFEKKLRESEAAVEKMLEAYDLKPHGLPAVPDDPPPHEGAMIDYPIVIEPPDLVLIEVLEALPGRPISGERLVRPDGKISLGFYGEVHVAGLTVEQAKVKILKHLREILGDETLGLINIVPEEAPPLVPAVPAPGAEPPRQDQDQKEKADSKVKKTGEAVPGRPVRLIQRSRERRSAETPSHHATVRFRAVTRRVEQDEKNPAPAREPVKIPLEAGGRVHITIETQGKAEQEPNPFEADLFVPGPPLVDSIGPPVPPERNDRVFVDVTAYNSKHYFVLGDVGAPGKLPFTGRETVMDAIQYANGFLGTAERNDVHLVRPARGGKPARILKVDLDAIQNKGDATTNYQIFPGDRLVVGRNDVVKKTIQMDRLAAPLQTVFNSILQESFMVRSLQNLDPSQHSKILEALVDFWVQALKQTDGVKFDEKTLRDALIKHLK